jgi:ribokinase
MATLDVLIRCERIPTWEGGAGFDELAFDGGGPVGTAMAAAARLGAAAGCVSTAGSDEFAERKMVSLRECGVDTSRMRARPGPERQIVICYVHAGSGERVFAGRKGLGDDPLRVEELDRDYITAASYLHLDGFHGDAALQAAQWMRAAGKTVVFDGGKTTRGVSDRSRRLIETVDVLIAGAGFLRGLTGVEDLTEAGRQALRLGPRIVVETLGERGCHTVTADDAFHTPAFRVEVVDTTGAGDVFHGAYIVGLLRGWGPRTTAVFASAVSALKCTRLGGRRGIPCLADVHAFLRARQPDVIEEIAT